MAVPAYVPDASVLLNHPVDGAGRQLFLNRYRAGTNWGVWFGLSYVKLEEDERVDEDMEGKQRKSDELSTSFATAGRGARCVSIEKKTKTREINKR